MQQGKIILEDTTLRDGEQSPGVAFSKENKIAIHDALVDAGVRWMELGIPAMGGQELEAIKEILHRGSPATLVAWNRGIKKDVEQSIKLGFKAIHIGLPTSNIHLSDSIRKDRKWLLEQSADLIKFAKDKGVFVSISAEDVGRSDISFVQQYASHVQEAGADRLRLSDTVGVLTPEKYAHIIREIKKAASIDLQCHTHNDFGLATANTIAGLMAGARYFHVTVNAIGERAGMPDFSQVVMTLKHLYDIELNIDTSKLRKLSALVQKASMANCLPWQPIIGENVFAHESGIHANGTLRNSNTFEPFCPEEVSGQRKIIIGKHSGRASINFVLKKYQINASEDELSICLEKVREKSMDKACSLYDGELLEIYHQSKISNEQCL